MGASVKLEFDAKGKVRVQDLSGDLPPETKSHVQKLLGWVEESNSKSEGGDEKSKDRIKNQKAKTQFRETSLDDEQSDLGDESPDPLLDLDDRRGIDQPRPDADPTQKRADAQAQDTAQGRQAPNTRPEYEDRKPSISMPPYLKADAGGVGKPLPVSERTLQPSSDGAPPLIRDTNEASHSVLYAQKDQGSHIQSPESVDPLLEEMLAYDQANDEENASANPSHALTSGQEEFQTEFGVEESKSGIEPPPNVPMQKWNTLSPEEQADYYSLRNELNSAVDAHNADETRRISLLLRRYDTKMNQPLVRQSPTFPQAGAATAESMTSQGKEQVVPEAPAPVENNSPLIEPPPQQPPPTAQQPASPPAAQSAPPTQGAGGAAPSPQAPPSTPQEPPTAQGGATPPTPSPQASPPPTEPSPASASTQGDTSSPDSSPSPSPTNESEPSQQESLGDDEGNQEQEGEEDNQESEDNADQEGNEGEDNVTDQDEENDQEDEEEGDIEDATTEGDTSGGVPSLFAALDRLAGQQNPQANKSFASQTSLEALDKGLRKREAKAKSLRKSMMREAQESSFLYGDSPFFLFGSDSFLPENMDALLKASKEHRIADKRSASGRPPRAGAKYLRREWKGDHWDYTYADDLGKEGKLATSKEGFASTLNPKLGDVLYLPLHEALQHSGVAHKEAKDAMDSYFRTIAIHERGLQPTAREGKLGRKYTIEPSPEKITVHEGEGQQIRLSPASTYLAIINGKEARKKEAAQALSAVSGEAVATRKEQETRTVQTFEKNGKVTHSIEEAETLLDRTRTIDIKRSRWRVALRPELQERWKGAVDSVRKQQGFAAKSKEEAEQIASYIQAVEDLRDGGAKKLKDVFAIPQRNHIFPEDSVAGKLERGEVAYSYHSYQSEFGPVVELRPSLTDQALKDLVTKDLRGIVVKAASRALRMVGIQQPSEEQKEILLMSAMTEVHRVLSMSYVAKEKGKLRVPQGYNPAKGGFAGFIKSALMSQRYWDGALLNEAKLLASEVLDENKADVEEVEDWKEQQASAWKQVQTERYINALRGAGLPVTREKQQALHQRLKGIKTLEDAISFATNDDNRLWASLPNITNTQDDSVEDDAFSSNVDIPQAVKDEKTTALFGKLHDLIDDSEHTAVQKEIMAEYLIAWEDGPEHGDSVSEHMLSYVSDMPAFAGRPTQEVKQAVLSAITMLTDDEDMARVLRSLRNHVEGQTEKSIVLYVAEMEDKHDEKELDANAEYRRALRVLSLLKQKRLWSDLHKQLDKSLKNDISKGLSEIVADQKRYVLTDTLEAIQKGSHLSTWVLLQLPRWEKQNSSKGTAVSWVKEMVSTPQFNATFALCESFRLLSKGDRKGAEESLQKAKVVIDTQP